MDNAGKYRCVPGIRVFVQRKRVTEGHEEVEDNETTARLKISKN